LPAFIFACYLQGPVVITDTLHRLTSGGATRTSSDRCHDPLPPLTPPQIYDTEWRASQPSSPYQKTYN
jgi:hypothetical protein